MAFIKVNNNKDEVQDYQGGNYINKSGMYPVTIKYAVVSQSAKGAVSINLIVDYEGQEQTLYQAFRITNNDGKDNTIGQSALNKLCIIAGIENELEDPVAVTIPLGKEGTPTEVPILEQLSDVEVIFHIKRVFSVYQEKISEQREIRNSFRISDKATAAEILNEKEPGIQYEVEAETAHKDRLDKNITQEEVDDYLKNRGKNSANKEQDVQPSSGFSKRKFGN